MTAEHEDFVLVHTQAGRSGWVSRANLVPVVANTSAVEEERETRVRPISARKAEPTERRSYEERI